MSVILANFQKNPLSFIKLEINVGNLICYFMAVTTLTYLLNSRCFSSVYSNTIYYESGSNLGWWDEWSTHSTKKTPKETVYKQLICSSRPFL